MARSAEKSPLHWLLLIHAIPPQPAYFRAKVGKRPAKVGAVAIENSVYVLPLNEETREDFQWRCARAPERIAFGGETLDALLEPYRRKRTTPAEA